MSEAGWQGIRPDSDRAGAPPSIEDLLSCRHDSLVSER